MLADWQIRAVLSSLVVLLCVTQSATGQLRDRPLPGNANLIVQGQVEQVYQPRSSDEYLVQILVQASEAVSLRAAGGNMRFPAPGEYVYVHVNVGASTTTRLPRGTDALPVPQPQSNVRAYLKLGNRNQWEASSASWFQDAAERPGTADVASGPSLGVTAERVAIGLQSGLKVTRIEPNSPAANAGIELGDILVKANGRVLSSAEQLETEFRNSRGKLELTVRDVRTGRSALVTVTSMSRAGMDSGAGLPGRKPLGITGELAFMGEDAVVKVTAVAAGSPAERAGIKPGLLITTANGQRVESPEALRNVERSSTGNLQLGVVDPQSRRESRINIRL
jgi:membrane-associated protease RseP (regulator of RpoE activity)